MEHGQTIRIGSSEFVFLVYGTDAEEPAAAARDSDVEFEYSTIHLNSRRPLPGFGGEVGRMARDLTAMVQISAAVNSIRNMRDLQRELLRLTFEVIPAQQGATVLLERAEGEPGVPCFRNRQDESDGPFELQRQLIHRAVWERTAVAVTSKPASGEPESILCVPLIGVEKIVGALYLVFRGGTALAEDHIHFMNAVAGIVAVAIENVRALDELRRENVHLHEQLNPSQTLVGETAQIRRVEAFINRVAASDTTVLIRGESGTGKEVVARAIHQNSARKAKPFVAINCAAIPETLLESELFGHEKGAFTGAVGVKKGKFEASDDGTLFLDEVGELPLSMQAKLLRVLQQREFERVGGTRPIPLLARVLAATNKDLELAIKRNEFRQDMYYRLNVVSISLPPLREHRDDIPLLALYFAARFAGKGKRPFRGISKPARTLMMSYSWPGNVRELENALEHALVLGSSDEILPEDLPERIFEQQTLSVSGVRYHDALNEAKRDLVRTSLREANGSVVDAAHHLGIHPKYLHRLITNLDLRSETR
jgi:Nif-specific regulatory protein